MKAAIFFQRLAATSLSSSKTYRSCHLPSSSVSDQYDKFYRSGSMALSEAHLSLLRKYLRVAPYLLLTDDPDLVASTIWHTDLCAGNLFVDKGHITSVIDWLGP
ncbi:uncharacterized protein TERG_03871 [Trichophyton rubrum CBS 118892]|uniref:Aminoglycoside phosphotransferase domain-containing protein n=1 Tax=Trichophyton rubrum (strain ATCC MYA-4607 / CBS 118892) TaxID=559305 RepID=F2SP72_TRIRC|nr:uncharacterized protein TERG_03871 [Trichophyton rubrum CBS 118892]EGD87624.2 hypothetical protein TERG_03871 [Trichophyton rubrum CBS 118892]